MKQAASGGIEAGSSPGGDHPYPLAGSTAIDMGLGIYIHTPSRYTAA